MFNFLNTSVLFAAAAALIPLIIHLFSKRKVKIVEFSSLRHLKAMQKRQVRKLKIRQLLLLILRMLIILCVVLAFARPTTESGNLGAHAAVSAVILFDNSASMNRYVTDGNLYDIAKKRTVQLLDNFNEADEICLLPLAKTEQAELSHSFTSSAAALELLDKMNCQFSEADFDNALTKAVLLLENASSLNKEIYFITDRQRSSLPDSNYLENIEAAVYIVDLPLETIENIGLVSIDFGGQLILPGHDFVISAKVKNYSNSPKKDIIASLFIDGNRIAQTDLGVKANSEENISFTRSVSNTGFHSGYIEISDDKFPSDNKYYFSFNIPERSNMLIIDGDLTGRLLSLALMPSSDINQYWSIKTVEPNNLSGVQFWEYDVICITGAPRLEKTYIDRLKSFLRRGRAIFLTYGDQSDKDYFNQTYSEMSGVKIDQPFNPNFNRAGYYTFQSLAIEHPVFSVFNYEQNSPPQIKFYTLPKPVLTGDAVSILNFTGNRPALIEYDYLGGKVLTFTGLISPQYSDLTAHAFLYRLFQG